MTDISTEAMIAAVKKRYPTINTPHPDEDFIMLFSRLTPAEKALAVVCPKCERKVGEECEQFCGEKLGQNRFTPHPERVALVSEENPPIGRTGYMQRAGRGRKGMIEPTLEIICACGKQYSLHHHTVCPSCFAWPKRKLI